MPATVAPTADDVYTVVAAFIAAQLGLVAGVSVVQGYPNRVAMPDVPFVLMTDISKKRLGTNHISWQNPAPNAQPPIPFPTVISYTQPQQMTMQLDCYSSAASEWSDILSTLLRSSVGCDGLAPVCQPLYADDPVRIPLTNAEAQYEDRWKITLQLQYNAAVVTPQQFADTLTTTLIEVDATYPP